MALEFGEFRLDSATRQLCRSGVEVHLSPKAYALLALLVDNRSRAVSKQELHAQLWPDTFVSEATLSSLVAEVRGALHENARRPRFLRTLHGFGYAFCGEIAGEAAALPASCAGAFLLWEGGRVALREGENVVGRSPDAAIVLDAPSVSRRHARIIVTGDDALVEDMGSKNGTYLRGVALSKPVRLAVGDRIVFGSVTVTFHVPRSDASTSTQHI